MGSDMRAGDRVWTSTCSLGDAGELADGAVADRPADPAHRI